ncbi:MAG: DUF503 family protein [Bdellovibrionales bacterium]|nr:DUF503 family protein [Bdellovibrionales bacterium]
MWIGAGKVVLDFYQNAELREKERRLEELLRDLRKAYNLSFLEVADFDQPDRCVLGFAAVMPETWRESSCKSLIQKILKTIDESSFARVVSDDWDLISPF